MRAQNIANIRLWRLAIIYLCLWLAPGITLLLFHLLAAPDYIAGTTRVFGALANLFGPWTTIVTTLSDWPNAGARFSLSNAILTTAAIAVVVTTSMAVKRKWVPQRPPQRNRPPYRLLPKIDSFAPSVYNLVIVL